MHPVPARAFRLWADYWIASGSTIPPIYYWRETPAGGVLLVIPMSEVTVRRFLAAVAGNGELRLTGAGSALLDERRWLGAWSVIAADPLRDRWRSRDFQA